MQNECVYVYERDRETEASRQTCREKKQNREHLTYHGKGIFQKTILLSQIVFLLLIFCTPNFLLISSNFIIKETQ